MSSNPNVRAVDVAVVGAAGQTGRPLVRELVRRGASVRAVVHHPPSKGTFPDACSVRDGSLDDVDHLAGALRGAGAVHYIPPTFSPLEVEFGRNVLAAAAAVGVRRVIYHSVLHADTPAMPHHWRKFQVEGLLAASGDDWTVLRPAMYATTPLEFLDRSRRHLALGFSPDAPFTPVTPADLAAAAATVLLDGGHTGALLDLAGAEVLTHRQMAEQMGEEWGHPVAVRRVPAALVAAVASRRYGRGSFRTVKAMLDHYDAHGLVGDAGELRGLLGRDPQPFRAALAG